MRHRPLSPQQVKKIADRAESRTQTPQQGAREAAANIRQILKRMPDSMFGHPLIEQVKLVLNEIDIVFPEKK